MAALDPDLGQVWRSFRSALATFDGLRELESTEEREQRLDDLAEVIGQYAWELRCRAEKTERVRALPVAAFG